MVRHMRNGFTRKSLSCIFWWSVTSGRSPGTVNYSAICDPTPSGFHTSGLSTFDFGTSAHLTRCPNDELVELRQATLGKLFILGIHRSRDPAPWSNFRCEISLNSVSSLPFSLLELLQHLAQLGFESFGRQSGLARVYQHAIKQLCGFSECLLRLSVISKLGLTHLHTQHLDLNLCPPAVGCALFSWVLGSQSLAVCSWVLGSQSLAVCSWVLGSQSLAVCSWVLGSQSLAV